MTDLYLAWQATRQPERGGSASRAWYPVGKLEHDKSEGTYRFRYIRGASRARQEAGFAALDAFPDLEREYKANQLFSVFRNRVPTPRRSDFASLLERLALPSGTTDPLTILAVTGGRRQTDHFEVFPALTPDAAGRFSCCFFLHGARHVNQSARDALLELPVGQHLQIAVELNNPAQSPAIQLQLGGDGAYYMLGWAPRYLVADLTRAMAEDHSDITASVLRVNPPPAPFNQRLLVKLEGVLPRDYQPMASDDFKPIASGGSH